MKYSELFHNNHCHNAGFPDPTRISWHASRKSSNTPNGNENTYLDLLPDMAHISPPLDDLLFLQTEQSRARTLHDTAERRYDTLATKTTAPHT